MSNELINSLSVLDENNKSTNEILNTSINQSLITSNNLIDYPDSGVETARTLSPLSVFNSNNNNTRSSNSNHSSSMWVLSKKLYAWRKYKRN